MSTNHYGHYVMGHRRPSAALRRPWSPLAASSSDVPPFEVGAGWGWLGQLGPGGLAVSVSPIFDVNDGSSPLKKWDVYENSIDSDLQYHY